MQKSCDLYRRFGAHIDSPTPQDVQTAINELFQEDLPDLEEGDYAEHPCTFIEYGHESGDNWTKYVLEACRGGSLTFSKYRDQDDIDAEFELVMKNQAPETLSKLFLMLAEGEVENVSAVFS